MNENLDPGIWADYFNEFTRRNQSRPTKLEVFGEAGAQEEERGLPFNGISLDQRERRTTRRDNVGRAGNRAI